MARPSASASVLMDGFNARLRVVLQMPDKALIIAHALGVSESAVSRWKSDGKISLPHLIALCEYMNVSADWLLLGRVRQSCAPLAQPFVLWCEPVQNGISSA